VVHGRIDTKVMGCWGAGTGDRSFGASMIALLPNARVRACGWPLTIQVRAREICGNLSCTSMHFQALSCNGRLPKCCKIKYFASKKGTHNAGVEGSSPSLSTNTFQRLAHHATNLRTVLA